jgi:hypothetical protein
MAAVAAAEQAAPELECCCCCCWFEELRLLRLLARLLAPPDMPSACGDAARHMQSGCTDYTEML